MLYGIFGSNLRPQEKWLVTFNKCMRKEDSSTHFVDIHFVQSLWRHFLRADSRHKDEDDESNRWVSNSFESLPKQKYKYNKYFILHRKKLGIVSCGIC
jgi:hypothetical protein